MTEAIIFCADNPDRSRHYGDIQRVFVPTKRTLSWGKKEEVAELNKLAAEFYENADDLIDILYPSNIVDTAGAWDDIEFINFLYDRNFFDGCDGIITPDGAVFFEINADNLIETNYLQDDEGC